MKKLQVGDSINPEKLLGCEASLMLHVGGPYEFRLGQIVFEVLEDESDGYRSSMKDLVIVSTSSKKSTTKLDKVTLIEDGGLYSIKSLTDGYVWLTFGTDHSDDYYPSFVYNWTPRLSDADKELLKLIK